MSTLDWLEEAPGIWRTAVGIPEDLTPLALSQAQPKHDALAQMGKPAFPLPMEAIFTQAQTSRTVINFPLENGEHLFGLGLQFMKLNQRGRTRYLRVNSDPRADTGETHAPVPFYVSSSGYGVLVNTARIVTVHCGSCGRKRTPTVIRDRNQDRQWQATPPASLVEIVVPAEGAELLIFAGNTVQEVVQRYNLYCGGGTLPPRWGLGFWHRVPTSFSAEQVIEEGDEFRKRDFPCDVIGLEPGWHTKSYPVTYEWSPDRFPEPAEFVGTMKEKGFRINLWEHAYVSPDAAIHAALEPLSGTHTVWGGLAPDYSLEEAQQILVQQHEQEHLAIGVSGYKIDECDGSELTGSSWMFPAHAEFPSGHDGEQIRQIYGLLLQQMTAEMFRKRDQRTYGLVRASMTGSAPLPYVLYSDLYDHRQYVRALCNSSFSGLLWTPEIRSAANGEEWVRRLQVVCFSPLAMLNAWSSGMKPWSFPEVEGIVRKYMKLRMELLPYFYSAFARYHFDGTPPFRAMAFENVDDKHLDLDDQYMAGDSLLVAPLFAGEQRRDVYLPEGVWYEFETCERFEGDQTISVEPGLERIPVFVRDGAIIPMMPPMDHLPLQGEPMPLVVKHYGKPGATFQIFDDDGETHAYERGDYQWRTLTAASAPDGSPEGHVSEVEEERSSAYGPITWQFMVS